MKKMSKINTKHDSCHLEIPVYEKTVKFCTCVCNSLLHPSRFCCFFFLKSLSLIVSLALAKLSKKKEEDLYTLCPTQVGASASVPHLCHVNCDCRKLQALSSRCQDWHGAGTQSMQGIQGSISVFQIYGLWWLCSHMYPLLLYHTELLHCLNSDNFSFLALSTCLR